MLRKAVGGALLAATTYVGADAAAELLLLVKCRRAIMERAAANPRFLKEVGEPIAPGPWWNSSLRVSHSGHIVTATVPVLGSAAASDVTVRAARKGGLRSTLLYNLLGPGQWDVLVMEALIGAGPGGLPAAMSLLEAQEPTPPAGGHAAACKPCATPER